jgi:AraC-like DNA-binding protein
MVSIRCKMIVQATLDKLWLHYGTVDLGEVEVKENITTEQRDEIKTALLKSGLELMDDKKAVLIEKIKNVIVEMVHYTDELPRTKNSDYISEKLQYDYTYLANLFSEAAGSTIEHYIIAHKIERVKELLLYDELNLTQISYKLNYSSVAHLSNQFKKVTGLTPTFFKQLKNKRRITLENV